MSSTEQVSLGEMIQQALEQKEKEEYQRALNGQGALYSKPTGRVEYRPDAPSNVCLSCGKRIDLDVARVLGNNDGNLEGCSDCRVTNNDRPYDCDTLAIKALRSGDGHWKEDR